MNLILSLLLLIVGGTQSHASINAIEAVNIANMVESTMSRLSQQQGRQVRIRWGGGAIFQINTSPDHKANGYVIGIMPGVFQHPGMTREIFLLSVCHEYSHVVGGTPKFSFFPVAPTVRPKEIAAMKKLSIEGQSDFFATSVCMKEVYAKFSSEWPVGHKKVNTVLKNRCALAFDTAMDRSACYFASSASMDLIKFLSVARGNKIHPSAQKSSTHLVPNTDQTFGTYPELQCRLDTLLAGSICRFDGGPECMDKNQVVELRPRCWFIP